MRLRTRAPLSRTVCDPRSTAPTPEGQLARALPAPRRATGPALFTLFAHEARRFGALETVTLRVRGDDEAGPRHTAPCDFPRELRNDAALTSWLARARTGAPEGEGPR